MHPFISGGNQSLFSNNNAQQYPSQGGSGFPGQNSMSYQPTGQTGGYQPQFQQQNTSFINNTQSQLNQVIIRQYFSVYYFEMFTFIVKNYVALLVYYFQLGNFLFGSQNAALCFLYFI